jgi:hypothetical protein
MMNLFKYYKKILKLKSIDMKLIRNVPNLHVIKTFDVTKKDLQKKDTCYVYSFHDSNNENYDLFVNNAISNIYVNLKYVESYKIYVGGMLLYSDKLLTDEILISQKNLQLIPCTTYHVVQIELKFNTEQQLNDNCFLFSFDLINYNFHHEIQKNMNNIYDNVAYLSNMVCNKYTINIAIDIPDDCSEDVIIATNFNKNTHANKIANTSISIQPERFLKINIHNSLNMIDVWFVDDSKSNNRHYLELVDNHWNYSYLEQHCCMLSMFVKFKKYSKDKYITCDAVSCNCIMNSKQFTGLKFNT